MLNVDVENCSGEVEDCHPESTELNVGRMAWKVEKLRHLQLLREIF